MDRSIVWIKEKDGVVSILFFIQVLMLKSLSRLEISLKGKHKKTQAVSSGFIKNYSTSIS